MNDKDSGASAVAEQALVSDQAPAGLDPSGFDPSRGAVKSLDDVKSDMSALYEELKRGHVDVKLASELANITGKYLKAEQLKLAREIFISNQPSIGSGK